MNKFDSHVINYEKYLLDLSMRFTGFLKEEKISERQSSRPFKNYRLIEYMQKDNKILDFPKFTNEYRKGKKYYE